MKVALVYDWVNKYGGAERVIEALHLIWPKAPLYTAVYDRKKAPWADSFKVHPSFLQNIPFAKSHHEFFPFLISFSFESFNFDEYDVVISVTSYAAKGIITKPKTLHICYCLTPTRFLWSGYETYKSKPGFGLLDPLVRIILSPVTARLRAWDYVAGERPDIYFAISNEVKNRIRKYYHHTSTVIYPGVDCELFTVPSNPHKNSKYFLIVSRLVSYKRVDIAIEAANNLRLPLKIIGTGNQKGKLKNLAGDTIEFINDHLTDSELVRYYQDCTALIFPSEEDFGLTPLEAQACGKPVIAFRGGGVQEIIQEGINGAFFYPQEPVALINVLKNFDPRKYPPVTCRENAEKFDKKIFMTKFKKFVEEAWAKQKEGQI